MKFDIDSIKRGDKPTIDLNFTLDIDTIDFYGEPIQLRSPIDVNGKLYVIDDRLYISCKMKTSMQVSCSRCLESFTHHFESSIDAEIVHESLSDEYKDDVDEDIVYYDEGTIDLSRLVKEHMIMNIPMKLVCDASCQGLCSRCGMKLKEGQSCNCCDTQSIDEDIDPRLAKLKNLLQQN